MKPIIYWHCQMRLEGLLCTADGLMVSAADASEPAPLLVVANMADGETGFGVAARLPAELRERLSRATQGALQGAPMTQAFTEFGISTRSERFRTYVFPASFTSAEVEGVTCVDGNDPRLQALDVGGMAQKVFAVEAGELVLSACTSSRQDSACGEAWVVTRPEYRRRGLAQRVVTVWARSLLSEGMIPFYSHKTGNNESASLAARLGLIHVFDAMVVEEVS